MSSAKGVIRVYFKDNTYKSIPATNDTTPAEVCNAFAKKMQLRGMRFILLEVIDSNPREIEANEKPFLLHKKWLAKGINFGESKNNGFMCLFTEESLKTLKSKIKERVGRGKLRQSLFVPPSLSPKPSSAPTPLVAVPITPAKRALNPEKPSSAPADAGRGVLDALHDMEQKKDVGGPIWSLNTLRENQKKEDADELLLNELESLKASLGRQRSKTELPMPTFQTSLSNPELPKKSVIRNSPDRDRNVAPAPKRAPAVAQIREVSNQNIAENHERNASRSKVTQIEGKQEVAVAPLSSWTIEQVCKWLRVEINELFANKFNRLTENGLQEYEHIFKDQAIDGLGLILLSEEDFKELGIKIGHRKKIILLLDKMNMSGASSPTALAVPRKEQPTDGKKELVLANVSPTKVDRENDADLDRLIMLLSGVSALEAIAENEEVDVDSFLSLVCKQLED